MAIINHDLLNKLYWEEKDGKDFRLRLGKQIRFKKLILNIILIFNIKTNCTINRIFYCLLFI
jgi:hypothetical protein